jgi:hypothetical protein
VTTLRRAFLIAMAGAGATGCAILAATGVNLATQGAAALAIIPAAAMQEGMEKDRCVVAARKGVTITQSLENKVPGTEGAVRTFEPAYWRPEFESEGYPQVERARTPVEGTLVLTDRSLLVIPPAGMTSLRIPYELVMDVSVNRGALDGAPRSTIVKSCSGRYDIFTFRRQQPDGPDPEATAAAAALLKARVAAFDAAGN